MGSEQTGSGELGSLAQSARGKQLKTARWILFVVGVLTAAINGYFVMNAETLVKKDFQKEIQKLRRQGMQFDKKKVRELEETAIKSTMLVSGVATALGVVFIVFGFVVYKFPVPVTITSLILYVGAIAVFGLLDPMSIVKGIIMKIFIIVGLASAVKAAIAYEKERQKQDVTPPFGGDSFSPPSAEF